MNPLFNQDDTDDRQKLDKGYVLAHAEGKDLAPFMQKNDRESAVNLIRSKIDAIYTTEPDVKEEIVKVEATPLARSKHQQFMHDISNSGKSLAEIQTAWHNYYVALPDAERREVWQEFYATAGRTPSSYTQYVAKQLQQTKHATNRPSHPDHPLAAEHSLAPQGTIVAEHTPPPEIPSQNARQRGIKNLRSKLTDKIVANAKDQERAIQNLRSVIFGVTTGGLVLLIFLFGLFNEMVIAPFIQPANSTGNAPIILASSSVAPSTTPEVIIPKINVEIPVVYDEPSVEEAAIQKALERGVIHYASTSVPGQKGNVAIFGHSSNNIFNKGAYKFAFVKLRTLEPGDVFHLTYGGKVYSYKTYAKRVVDPSETTVLDPVADKIATATLITCDPPGTSNKRMVIWGEQISPDPSGATESEAQSATATPTQISSNGPTLFSRIWHTIF